MQIIDVHPASSSLHATVQQRAVEPRWVVEVAVRLVILLRLMYQMGISSANHVLHLQTVSMDTQHAQPVQRADGSVTAAGQVFISTETARHARRLITALELRAAHQLQVDHAFAQTVLPDSGHQMRIMHVLHALLWTIVRGLRAVPRAQSVRGGAVLAIRDTF
jgi:hypothetical protein